MRKPSAVQVVIPEQIVVQLSHNAGVAPASARSGNILIPASRSPGAACPRRFRHRTGSAGSGRYPSPRYGRGCHSASEYRSVA